MKILVLENEAIIKLDIIMTLKKQGYDVSGFEGESYCDCIIIGDLDNNSIKALDLMCNLKAVVLLLEDSKSYHAFFCFKLPFIKLFFLEKPFTEGQLLSTVYSISQTIAPTIKNAISGV